MFVLASMTPTLFGSTLDSPPSPPPSATSAATAATAATANAAGISTRGRRSRATPPGYLRSRRKKAPRQVSGGNLVERHGTIQILQSMLPERPELDLEIVLLVGEQRLGRLRDEHLPSVRGGANAGGTVDGKAAVAAVRDLHLAGVDSHPHLELGAVRPLSVAAEQPLRVHRREDGVADQCERVEERVALRVQLRTAVPGESLPGSGAGVPTGLRRSARAAASAGRLTPRRQ